MGEEDIITDEEELYRSVRGNLEDKEYYYDDSGTLRITHDAFRDRNKEPSVDRAKLRNHNPVISKKSQTDGVVSLMSRDVRAIGDVVTRGDQGNVKHSVDIIYKPIREIPVNPAHSQVTVRPEFFGSKNKQKKAFKLLRIALARLATKNGWTVKPEKF